MKKTIDCLFLGHNEENPVDYEKTLRRMGPRSGAYRDLNLSIVWYDNRPYSASDIYNLFSSSCTSPSDKRNSGNTGYRSQDSPGKPLSMGDIFSPAIAYLGTYLHKRNFSFDYINSFQAQKQELAEKLQGENILTIAIITTLYVSVFPILEIMNFIKKHNQTAKIVIGGPFISTQFRTQTPDSLKYLLEATIGADFYVNSSQGEATLVNILHALKNNLPLEQINNIYYKKGNGYACTAILKEVNQLSENMVNWDLFRDQVAGIVSLRTAISCPFACSFCGFPERAGKYQFVDARQVQAELDTVDKIDSIRRLNFIDDTFNVPMDRFKDILKIMIREKYRFRWVSNLRCHLVDREMVELMKESGCEGVFLGLESANDQVLKHMNKAATVEKYRRGIALLKEYGIVTMGSFIVGFPGETPGTVRNTIEFIRETGIDFFRAQLWYCEPITPIWKCKEQFNIQGEHFEWKHNTMDAHTASDLIEEMFLTLKESLWVPQYHFDYDKIWQLKLRGMEISQIKTFISTFNKAVEQRFNRLSPKEIGFELINQLQRALNGTDAYVLKENSSENEAKKDSDPIIDPVDVTFNF